jgi:ABC-type nitrate/sulfonate/bicarbonate transport system ATPase subunit/ABC-type nitrate/sulfonate/bicarbonate transport system permease component
MREKRPPLSPVWYLAGIAALLALWQAGAALAGSSLVFPGPLPVFRRLAALARSSAFLPALAGSLGRVLAGMALSVPAGLLCGLLSGLDRRAAAFLKPLFSIIAATPVMSVILIAFLVFGSGGTPVFTSVLMVFPVMAANTLEGVRAVSPELKEMFRVYRVPRSAALLRLYLPSIVPFALGGLRSSLALCWKVVTAAEVLTQPLRALGTGMQTAKAQLETPELFAWTAATVIAAALTEHALFLLLSCYNKRRRKKEGEVSPSLRSRGVRLCRPAASSTLPPLLGGGAPQAPRRIPRPALSLSGVSFAYGDKPVFRDFSLDAALEQSPLVILGPSGCGKTTLLRLIAGLLPPDAGSVSLAPPDGALSFLFQEPRLAPRLTALENVVLPLKPRFPAPETEERARFFLDALGLADKAGAYPSELSGGQRQRVSMARAFACPAPVLLMDEPFQALDIPLRLSLMDSACAFLAREPRLVIAVTHDPREAVRLARRAVVLGPPPEGIVFGADITLPPAARDYGSPASAALEQRLLSALRGQNGK